MNSSTKSETMSAGAVNPHAAALGILFALSLSHLLNDTIQALLPAVYPLLKDSFQLSFAQIGMITFCFQMIGSVFQPLIGIYTDRYPKPYSLVIGMGITLCGLVLLAFAPRYELILVAAGMVGLGSAIFHPESSRMARLASGGRHGFAQSLFQVGGNIGTSLGPLLAAWIIVPRGQRYILVFTMLALAGMFVLGRVGTWYASRLAALHTNRKAAAAHSIQISRRTVMISLAVLLLLMFSKFIYLASITNYYTFYLMQKFGVSVQASQYLFFIFLFGVAVGTMVGGPIGDRLGRKLIIWISILGMAPFTMLLPHVNLFWTAVLSAIIGFVMASAFPAIVVYATELLPGKVGMVAGLFFGLAFGTAGIASALLGKLADATSIPHVIFLCGFLPWIGLVAVLLPDLRQHKE